MTPDQEALLKNVFETTLGIGTGGGSGVPVSNLSQKNCAAWDSIAHLNLIIAIEAAFDVAFEPEEISAMQDFSRVAAVLSEKLAAGGNSAS